MGLDQYAYAAYERGERRRALNDAARVPHLGTPRHPTGTPGEFPYKLSKPHELAYWRKHQKLQDWMDNLWREKGEPYPEESNDPRWGSTFNGVELELEWNDIQRLEDDIKNCRNEFSSSYDYYREEDLKFCLDAKEQLFLYRKRVFYYPSW
jgi:hypothetical protein